MLAEHFEHVYRELYPRLLGHGRRHLDEATASDVVASTFETLWKKGLSYPGEDESAWRRLTSLAHEVLKGHVVNEYRSRRRRTTLWHRLACHHPGEEPHADDTARVDSAATVVDWLAPLSDDDRRVIALFHAGFSADEMARELGCSVAAATRRRDRARQRLRKLLSEHLLPRARADPAGSAIRVDSDAGCLESAGRGQPRGEPEPSGSEHIPRTPLEPA